MLVTSRHTLAGLGARLVDLNVLGEHESVALLVATVRAARTRADGWHCPPEPCAVRERNHCPTGPRVRPETDDLHTHGTKH